MDTDDETSLVSKRDETLKLSKEVIEGFTEIAAEFGKLLADLPQSKGSFDRISARYSQLGEPLKSWNISKRELLDNLQSFVDDDKFSMEFFSSILNPVRQRKDYLDGAFEILYLILVQWAVACGKAEDIQTMQKEYKRIQESGPDFPMYA